MVCRGLLEAGEKNSQVVVPQIAGLVVDREIMPREKETKYFRKFNTERAQNLFQEDLSRAMRLLANEIDVSTFSLENKETIRFAQEEAKKWLATQR
jgi:hypothetical protein